MRFLKSFSHKVCLETVNELLWESKSGQQGNTCVRSTGNTKNNMKQELSHSKTHVSPCFYLFCLCQHHLLPTWLLPQGNSKFRAQLANLGWLQKGIELLQECINVCVDIHNILCISFHITPKHLHVFECNRCYIKNWPLFSGL